MSISTACKKKHGFTLVEMIVTITLIVILLSGIVISLIGYIEKARQATLIARCNDCVLAAQTVMDEKVAFNKFTEYKNQVFHHVTGPEVAALAQVSAEEGYVGGMLFDEDYTLTQLTYHDTDSKDTVTYQRDTSGTNKTAVTYSFTEERIWVKGDTYTAGEVMEAGGFLFVCLKSHKSGSRSNTRNPTVKSNKGSWEVIGYAGEMMPYSSTVRYAEGVATVYNGNIYTRTEYNLTGGQTPYSKSSSRYWILVGPAP